MTNVTVLGAGAWGTAFGQVLADAGNNVTMWAIEPEIVEGIRDHHHNGVRLPSVKVLPSNMTATCDRAEAVANADIVIYRDGLKYLRTELLKVLTPPSLEMERVFIKDDVSGAAWTTFAPVSRSWPFPAKVMPVNSILAPRPFKMLIGYR